MLNIIILFIILIGLIIHRYLSFFWEEGFLPYSMGFQIFATLFMVLCAINYIWMFGFWIGIVVFLLTFFQLIYASYLWPFLLPSLISILKKSTIPRVSVTVYGLWSFVVLGLIMLTILNFFVSDYMSLLETIVGVFNYNYKLIGLLLIGSMIIGNIVRSYIMSKFVKK